MKVQALVVFCFGLFFLFWFVLFYFSIDRKEKRIPTIGQYNTNFALLVKQGAAMNRKTGLVFEVEGLFWKPKEFLSASNEH